DEPVEMYFAEDAENPVVINPLLAAVLVQVVNLGSHELGQRSHLFDAVIVIAICSSGDLWAIRPVPAGEMTGIEKQCEVGMVHFALETQHILARARETAVVLERNRHA